MTSGKRTLAALAIVVGVAVLREGSEVVLFLYGIVAQGFQPPQAVVDTIDRWLAKAAAPEVMN